MNYSIIKDIFLNKRCNSDKMPITETQHKIYEQLNDYEQKISKYLPENERKQLMWDYTLLQSGLNSEIENESFIEGFKIGLLIGAEVFSEINEAK